MYQATTRNGWAECTACSVYSSAIASHAKWRTELQCMQRNPPVFCGEAAQFKEWVFAVELALKALGLLDSGRMVDYAAAYLAGNARLWFISAIEGGVEFPDWPSLKDALAHVYGPIFDREQVRLDLFAATQRKDLDSYVTEFSRLSLQLPELDDHSRALLFTNGLAAELRAEVLKEHPTTLDQAIRAARTAERSLSDGAASPWTEVRPRTRGPPRTAAPLRKLTDGDRDRLRKEGRCFACRRLGHLAKDCNQQPPNELRQ